MLLMQVRPGGEDEECKLDTAFGFTSDLLAGVGRSDGEAKGAKDYFAYIAQT
jgi:hypothetical protein